MRRYLISENVDNSGWPLKLIHINIRCFWMMVIELYFTD